MGLKILEFWLRQGLRWFVLSWFVESVCVCEVIVEMVKSVKIFVWFPSSVCLKASEWKSIVFSSSSSSESCWKRLEVIVVAFVNGYASSCILVRGWVLWLLESREGCSVFAGCRCRLVVSCLWLVGCAHSVFAVGDLGLTENPLRRQKDL